MSRSNAIPYVIFAGSAIYLFKDDIKKFLSGFSNTSDAIGDTAQTVGSSVGSIAETTSSAIDDILSVFKPLGATSERVTSFIENFKIKKDSKEPIVGRVSGITPLVYNEIQQQARTGSLRKAVGSFETSNFNTYGFSASPVANVLASTYVQQNPQTTPFAFGAYPSNSSSKSLRSKQKSTITESRTAFKSPIVVSTDVDKSTVKNKQVFDVIKAIDDANRQLRRTITTNNAQTLPKPSLFSSIKAKSSSAIKKVRSKIKIPFR